MEKYMGYQAKEPTQRPERLYPELNIGGTLFLADIARLEFRQVDNPSNRMPILNAKEEMGFSHFFFDTQTKNLYAGDIKMPDGIPSHVQLILLPPLKDIDPVGLARQQGLSDSFYSKHPIKQRELTAFSREEKQNQIHRKSRGQGI